MYVDRLIAPDEMVCKLQLLLATRVTTSINGCILYKWMYRLIAPDEMVCKLQLQLAARVTKP